MSGSFPSRTAESGAPEPRDPYSRLDGLDYNGTQLNGFLEEPASKDDSFGEATFLDFEGAGTAERRQSTLDEIEQEVNKVRVALDEDCRALDDDERHLAEADNWSLNVSCDSGVYNRASSRDSGPHSGQLYCRLNRSSYSDGIIRINRPNMTSYAVLSVYFVFPVFVKLSTAIEAVSAILSQQTNVTAIKTRPNSLLTWRFVYVAK